MKSPTITVQHPGHGPCMGDIRSQMSITAAPRRTTSRTQGGSWIWAMLMSWRENALVSNLRSPLYCWKISYHTWLFIRSGPCKRQSFTTKPIEVGSGAASQMYEEFGREFGPSHWLALYFNKKTAYFHTRTYRVGTNDLISAVGGGLGLFMGFSLLATLMSAKNIVRNILEKQHNPIQRSTESISMDDEN